MESSKLKRLSVILSVIEADRWTVLLNLSMQIAFNYCFHNADIVEHAYAFLGELTNIIPKTQSP